MFYKALFGLAAGVCLGLLFPFHIPPGYSQYVAVGLLAGLDSLFGGLNARLHGKFDGRIFLSGFFGNTVIAVLLTMLGARLDLNLYLAAVVIFGGRLFQNFAEIRRYLLNLSGKKDSI